MGFFKMLTKSNYLLGLQCKKLLWVTKNNKSRLPELDSTAKKRFKEGTLIGELATALFPDGIDLKDLDFDDNIKKTKKLIEKRETIFEGSFLVDDLYSRCDILVPTGKDKWDVIEVKSASDVKDINIQDVSFQRYVYKKAGLKIRKCYLMHINSGYIKKGDIDPSELFKKADITEEVIVDEIGLKERISEMLDIIDYPSEPKIKIGEYCKKPYVCALKDKCWIDVPRRSVFEFSRIRAKKAFSLYNEDIKLMHEVPDSIKLSEKQTMQRFLEFSGGVNIEEKQIKHFLKNLNYPIYYLDFETINPAVPIFDKSTPYQQIPFQYSLHIQEEPNGKLRHVEFLAEGLDDPRIDFLESLKENLGDSGDILVYNQAFEKMILRQGHETFGEYKEWHDKNILPRIKDLMVVFSKFWYYDPKQKGSYSIKAVLPVLSDLKYDDLDIKKGDVASNEFFRVTYEDASNEDRKKVRADLLKYCELDTLAEVEIVKALGKLFE